MLKINGSSIRYVELEQCLASTAGLREQLEQEAAAARQEAAQAQEEARMAQVCYFVNSQEKWAWAVAGFDSWAAGTAGAGGSSCQVVGCAGSIADPDPHHFGEPDPNKSGKPDADPRQSRTPEVEAHPRSWMVCWLVYQIRFTLIRNQIKKAEPISVKVKRRIRIRIKRKSGTAITWCGSATKGTAGGQHCTVYMYNPYMSLHDQYQIWKCFKVLGAEPLGHTSDR